MEREREREREERCVHHSISFRIEVSPSKGSLEGTSSNNITPMGSFKGSENDQVAHFGERRSYPMMANGNIQHLFQSSRTKLQGHDKFANANKLMRCLT